MEGSMKLEQIAPVFTGNYAAPQRNGARVTPSDDRGREKRQHHQKDGAPAHEQPPQEGGLVTESTPTAGAHAPHLDITA